MTERLGVVAIVLASGIAFGEWQVDFRAGLFVFATLMALAMIKTLK